MNEQANTGVRVADQAPSAPPGKRKPRAKPQRHIRIVVPLYAGEGPGVIRISVEGQEPMDYVVRVLPCDWPAKAFSLAKVGAEKPEEYHVLIEAEGGSCECKGFLRWQKCKHFDGLRALIERGLL
jgi:hypothetical protein